jgi:hypothetical protein
MKHLKVTEISEFDCTLNPKPSTLGTYTLDPRPYTLCTKKGRDS